MSETGRRRTDGPRMHGGSWIEEWIFVRLMRLYPRPFRRRYGSELVEFFRAERRRPRFRGLGGAFRFWKETLGDLLKASFRGRLQSIPSTALMRLASLPRHLKLSIRSLRRQPGFAAVVTLTLALGIAAVLVVFTLVDAALLEAIPLQEGERLVFVRGTTTVDRQDVRAASVPELRAWVEGAGGFEVLAGVTGSTLNLELDDGVRPLPGQLVTGDYFEVLRVRPLLGRLIGPGDDRTPDGHPVVVIHEEVWEQQFDRDPDIVGRSVRINGRELTVIGVTPSHFAGTSLVARAWVPMTMASLAGQDGAEDNWGRRWIVGIGRLAEGVSIEEAQAEVDAVALELARQRPESNEGRTGTLVSARSVYLGSGEDLLMVLLAASGILLLVATTNAAGLLTVRSASQRDEHALCMALGAGRGTVAGRALTDALVLAALAAGVAWLLARWALGGLLTLLPPGALPPFVEPRLDAGVLGVAFGVVVVAALLAGVLPALASARGDLTNALRNVRSTGEGGDRRLTRSPQRLLVVAEVAIAVVLLVGTGLMVRTFQEKLAIDEGFEAAGLSTVFSRMTGEEARDGEALRGFAERARERLAALPEVEAVTYGSDVPLRGGNSASILVPDPSRMEERVRYYRHRVAPDFRRLLGIELLRGRDFGEDDRAEAPTVVLVGRAFADRFLGGVDAAVGREMLIPGGSVTVVGVVETVRWRDLTSDLTAGEDDADVYFPFAQQPVPVIEFPMRTRSGEVLPLPRLREAIADVDPGVAVFLPVSLEDGVRLQTAGDRLTVTVLGIFGVAALLLAGTAVYGALASAVVHRRREIALRLALGASVSRVRRAVLGQGARLAALGVIVGAALALAVSRYLADLLFGIAVVDVVTYGGVIVLLLAVALLATWVPAVRATRVEPQKALRS